MSRMPRQKSLQRMYHIVQSGINNKAIFELEQDKRILLEIILTRKEELGFKLLGYCVLDDHFHLVIREGDKEISKIMQSIQVRFANYYNANHGTMGQVFKERFQSEPIEEMETLKAMVRFVNRSPIRKGINHPFEYPWCSYMEYVNKSLFCEIDEVLEQYNSDRIKAVEALLSHTQEANSDVFLDYREDFNHQKAIKGLLDAETYVADYLYKRNLTKQDLKSPIHVKHRSDLIKALKLRSTLSIRKIADVLEIGRSIVERTPID